MWLGLDLRCSFLGCLARSYWADCDVAGFGAFGFMVILLATGLFLMVGVMGLVVGWILLVVV